MKIIERIKTMFRYEPETISGTTLILFKQLEKEIGTDLLVQNIAMYIGEQKLYKVLQYIELDEEEDEEIAYNKTRR